MSEDPAPGDLLDLLSDEYARDILAATSARPMSAQQLAEQYDMSEATVYRRVDRLQEQGLLKEQNVPRTSGNHYSVYVATLSEVSVELDDGSFETDVERSAPETFPGQDETDPADRFTRMWENL